MLPSDGVPVNIALFGPMIVRKNGVTVSLSITGHTLELLKFLLTHAGMPFRRDYLCELFWPDSADKRKKSALNTALWRIRSQVAERLDVQLVTEGECSSVELGPDVRIDSLELSKALAELQNSREAQAYSDAELRLARALEMSDQPFLDGLSSEWALAARQRYSEIKSRALALMMRRCGESHRFDDAIDYGSRLLDIDPFREDTQCEMMWLYVLSGRRSHAIRQYQRCSELLEEELGIEPMAEMQLLYRQITQSGNELAFGSEPRQDQSNRGMGPLFEAIARSRNDVYSALCQQLSCSL